MTSPGGTKASTNPLHVLGRWQTGHLGDVITLQYGKSLPEPKRKPGAVPVFGSNGIIGHHDKPLSHGQTIIVGRKGSVGAVHFCPGPCWPIDTTYYIDRFEDIEPRYVLHLLRYLHLDQFDTSTSIPGLNRNDLYEVQVPLPPLIWQKRIVRKIEELLAYVNAARGRLARVKTIMKSFRQAVLAAAVSGRLTANWREQHPDQPPMSVVLGSQAGSLRTKRARAIAEFKVADLPSIPDTWSWAPLAAVSESVLGKMLDKDKNTGELRPYLRNINVRWRDFDLTDVQEMRFENGEEERYGLRSRDVLVCEGGEPGRAAVWRGNSSDMRFQKAIHRVRCGDQLQPDWLVIVLQAHALSGLLSEYFTGTGITHLTGVSLARVPIPLPPIDEQTEIVRLVDSLWSLAEEISGRAELAARTVDRISQAILAKAFRGELVPTEAELTQAQLMADSAELSTES